MLYICLKRNRAVAGFNYIFYDGKSHSHSAAFRSEIRREHFIQQVIGDALAVIGDGEYRLPVHRFKFQPDLSGLVLRYRLNRILDKVNENPRDLLLIGHDANAIVFTGKAVGNIIRTGKKVEGVSYPFGKVDPFIDGTGHLGKI